ncbi:MAG: hypothetical protein P4M15_13185 [Alphaproteobacteria bacterium]|nr:hypothetical protein [Alphaproteobacteria bacterium]
MTQREILIETQRYGTSLRVSATDTQTGTEVVFQAPVSTLPARIKQIAISKMTYVLNKK